MGYESIQFRGSPSGEVVQTTFVNPDLASDEVAVKLTHSGLCGTDLHMLKTDMVLGHEGIGIVHDIGSAVTAFKVGDRVGWGYPNWSCGLCDPCLSGQDSYCVRARLFGEADFDSGSLSNLAVRKDKWLFKIPDSLASEDAAPLMCGGATVFTPLVDYVKPYDRVGIVGVGGLGHLAIQFAARMGCDVVVLSGTESKREEAFKMGAKEFYATNGVTNYSTLGIKPIDRLLITTSTKADLSIYYPILAMRATVLPLTVAVGELTAPYLPTILNGIQVVGSKLATRFAQQKLLDFAARNDIHVIAEKFPMTLEGVRTAVKKLGDGGMRYRGVLYWE